MRFHDLPPILQDPKFGLTVFDPETGRSAQFVLSRSRAVQIGTPEGWAPDSITPAEFAILRMRGREISTLDVRDVLGFSWRDRSAQQARDAASRSAVPITFDTPANADRALALLLRGTPGAPMAGEQPPPFIGPTPGPRVPTVPDDALRRTLEDVRRRGLNVDDVVRREFGDVLDRVSREAAEVLKPVQDALGRVLDEAAKLAGEARDVYLLGAARAWNGLRVAAREGLDIVTGKDDNLVDQLLKDADKLTSPLLDNARDAFDATAAAVAAVGEETRKWANEAIDAARDAVDEVGDLVGDVAGALGSLGLGLASLPASLIGFLVEHFTEKMRDGAEGAIVSTLTAAATVDAARGEVAGFEIQSGDVAALPGSSLDNLGPVTIGNALKALGDFAKLLVLGVAGLSRFVAPPMGRSLDYAMNRILPNQIPGPGDLVSFAVREVFNPVNRREQLADLPGEDFYSLMRNHGYSRERANDFWAAHWDLPSVTQGFDMLHRLRPGVVPANVAFTVDDLRDLLRQLDVLPKYRERLIALSYPPYTRVDVRRMYRLGVLDREGVKQAHLDLGYEASKAEALTEFTVRDQEPDDRALTRNLIQQAYEDGLMDRAAAMQRLLDLSYLPSDAELVLAIMDRQLAARAERKADQLDRALHRLRIRHRRKLLADKFDREELELELEALDLSPGEANDFIAALLADTSATAAKDIRRELSLGKLEAAYVQGVLTVAELRGRLAALGFDGRDAEVVVALAEIKRARAANKE